VQIQHAHALAQHGQCSEAVNIADHIAEPVSDLVFTRDGLEPFLRTARFSYLLGNVYKSCNLAERAEVNFKHAAAQSNLQDAVWSWKASREMPGFDEGAGKQKLESILGRAKIDGDASARTGGWFYNVGLLDQVVGHGQQAEAEFRQAFLSADQLLTYHLTRLAVSGSNP
jgi:hypothetical protein